MRVRLNSSPLVARRLGAVAAVSERLAAAEWADSTPKAALGSTGLYARFGIDSGRRLAARPVLAGCELFPGDGTVIATPDSGQRHATRNLCAAPIATLLGGQMGEGKDYDASRYQEKVDLFWLFWGPQRQGMRGPRSPKVVRPGQINFEPAQCTIIRRPWAEEYRCESERCGSRHST